MKIKFVNHASFIIDTPKVKLICDPWFEGTAFDNGWSLLSKTQMKYEDFSEITHIWFSHEHPDHFSPPNLVKIPLEYRKKITVLFQETTDRKVAEFCKKIGFKEQIELKENTFFEIAKDFEILCNPYTDGDSYALFRIDGCTILNLNDCIINSEKSASDLASLVGEVDILFTQFGYANKVGNVDDVEYRKLVSREKLERIKHQSKHLKPKSIVPFASFIYFCHEENKYMNTGMNTIGEVYSFIEKELNCKCVVLYPNDLWNVKEEWDAKMSIEKYNEDSQNVKLQKPLFSTNVKFETLKIQGSHFNNLLINGFPNHKRKIESLKANIYLTDLKTSFSFTGKHGLQMSTLEYDRCDIALSSESLSYCFNNLWGGDTLSVNARFQTTKYGEYKNFRIFGMMASHLNRKEPYNFPSFYVVLKGKIKRLLFRKN